ncbi:hypothetical protein BJX76DRAFT_326906 [Aspergillus varians]
MAPQPSQGASSPSASSIFLPLGRQSSRGSLSTQAERDSLNAALDQIHTAAYQSDALTVFNEFASPPAPASAVDDKSISDEIQGGLSGLYSRLRTSVGGMRDMVSGVGKSAEEAKRPPSDRLTTKRSPDSMSIETQQYPGSPLPLTLNSPTSVSHPFVHEGYMASGAAKSSKVSSKAGSISSKASVAPSATTRPLNVSLPNPPVNSGTADPAVTEVNVNAIKESARAMSDTPTTQSLHDPQILDSSGTDNDDYPQTTSLSSSSWSQQRTHSPVLQTKGYNLYEGSTVVDTGSTHSKSQVWDNSRRPDPRTGREVDAGFPSATRKHKHSIDGTQDATLLLQDRTRSDSSISQQPDVSTTAPVSGVDSANQFASGEDNTYAEGRTPSTIATSMSFMDGEAQSNESLKSRAQNDVKERPHITRSGRLPGYPASQTSSVNTTMGSPTIITPINTTFDRIPFRNRESRRPNGGDGVMTQLRSRLLSKDYWMRDENAKDCFHCGEPFSTFRRKHHCRTCGQIFDSKCTLLITGEKFGQPGTIRVCKPCEHMINGHEDDSSEFSDSEQSPIMVNPRVSEISTGNSSRVGADDDDAASIVSQSNILKTPTMAIPATRRAGEGHNRRSAILEISPDRPLARPTSSRSLKSSLSGRPHSMGHKRHHSRQQVIRNFKPYHDERAPFQRRHGDDSPFETRLPAFHKDNIIDPDLAQYLSDDASSGDEQPSLLAAVSEGPLSKSGGDNERTMLGGFFASMKKGRPAFGDRSITGFAHPGRDLDDSSMNSLRATNLPRSSRRRNLSVASSVHRHSPRTSKEGVFNPYDPQNSGHALPTTLNSSGFKMTRSSSMRGPGAPPVEMGKASLQHVRKLLRQLLDDSSVPHPQSWETALLPILLKAADEVDPEVQSGDDMDIRHYIKLKKIPGGRPGDTSYVSGLVFRKNVALKSMPRSIVQPKILIIAFALEYARHQQQFMSLEHVIRQEREFLENLVSRISALRPNLLLVEKNVSGLALELLDRAGIATVYNVKFSVLEAVSRCTQTRIITSMDKLVTTPVTSECGGFDVKTYVHKGHRKTYIYISGCRKELGCTIVLRGGNSDVLARVKRITEFMTYVVYNLRLETCVMRDEFAQLPTSPTTEKKLDDTVHQRPHSSLATMHDGSNVQPTNPEHDTDKDVSNDVTDVPDDVPMPTYYEDIVRDHETKLLSASPFVKFEPPYLLMRARKMERRLAYLKRLRDQSLHDGQSTDEKTKNLKFSLITPEMIHEAPREASPKVKEVLQAVHDAEYDRALYHYQTQKRQWEAYISGTVGLFDPYAHQNIVILFSLVCTTTSIPCSGPDLLALEFYNEHGDDALFEPDCTLGQYVEDICLNANAICTANGCEKRMYEHHRQYVHGEAQLSIFTQPYPSKLRGFHDTILMWSCCKICGNETQVFPMSDSTWKYSFGKYLELSFWSKNLHARAGVCPHDLQRDHLRYFGFKDIAIRIQYDTINLLEIIVPRTRVTWKVDNDLRLKNDVYQKNEYRITKFMLSVKARLKVINVESVLPDLMEDCKKEIESMTIKVNEDHLLLIKELQEGYMNSRYWEVIPLNRVMRYVQEKVVEWDTAFAEFEKNFFPSEKDIRRLATLQLKKIFLDRDTSVTSLNSNDEQPTTPTEPESERSQTPDGTQIVRRMTLSPEKAQDVLASVVEEHSGEKKRTILPESKYNADTIPAAPSPTPEERLTSTSQESFQEGAEDESGIHTTTSQADIDPSSSPSDIIKPVSDHGNPEAIPGDTDAVQEKISDTNSRKSNEIERPTPSSPSTPQHGFSSIPRPSEGSFRCSGKGSSPPLLRARSQPIQSLKDITKDSLKGTRLSPGRLHRSSGAVSPPLEFKPKNSEMKLSERFGLSAFRNGRLMPGQSLIPRSIPNKKNRVSSLAKHFEQLSREFEKERQRERDQRAAKGSHSRAYPLASSKPIVEVYKNVREAVEEREPSAEGDDLLASNPRLPADDSSRGSQESTRLPSIEEESRRPPASEPSTPMPVAGQPQKIDHNLSEGEAEEANSDEERTSVDCHHGADPSDELAKMSPEDESLDLKELPKHERSTLLKLLTNFWSERSASGWAPLDYPLTMSDHVFADCDIIVCEDEPSSLIAFALDSGDYKEKLASIQRRYEEASEKPVDPESGTEDVNEAQVEHALLRSTGTHLKYQFQEGQAKMLCKVFYAEQFDALRKKCGIADRIVESLSRCAKWDSKGGKTNSLFLKTLDDRFILKSLSPIETQAFLKFAPAYFQIMSEALFHELPSAIAKMFGFYQVIIKDPATNTEFNWFLLLMENLFYDRVPTRIFDLKGSMRNRKVQSTGERNEVLLDENMVDFIYETPLFSREHSKKLLSQSVWNDTLFLGRQNVMDYSLMIAIDESRSELVVGVIDCIRTYTWDKKLESWIKDRGFAGGGKNRPTVTSPKEYKSRFREAMARYVLQAPRSGTPNVDVTRSVTNFCSSCWHQFQSSQAQRYAPVDIHGHSNQHHSLADIDAAEGAAERGF